MFVWRPGKKLLNGTAFKILNKAAVTNDSKDCQQLGTKPISTILVLSEDN